MYTTIPLWGRHFESQSTLCMLWSSYAYTGLQGIQNLGYQNDIVDYLKEDKLSEFLAAIDGISIEAALFEYDEKNKLLFYTFDKKRLISGRKHKLQLIVTDKIGNKSNFKEEFIW